MKTKLWSRNYSIVILADFLVFFGFSMVATTLSKYTTDLGYSVSKTGLIIGVMSIAALLCRPFVGWICDVKNKKHLFALAILVYAASTFGYAFASNFYMFVGLRIVHGVAFAFTTTLVMVLFGSYVPKDRMGEGMGIASIASSLAFAFGPAFAIAIGNQLGYRYIFIVAALMVAIAGIVVSTLPYTHIKVTETFNFSLRHLIEKRAFPYALIIMVSSGICAISNGYVAVYSNQFAISNIGWYFTVGSIAAVVSKFCMGKLLDKWGFLSAFVPAIVLTGLSLILLGFVQQKQAVLMFLMATILLNLGTAGLDPLLQASILKRISEKRRGAASSTFYIGADVGQALGPIAGGLIAQNVGYGNMYLLYILPLVFVFMIGNMAVKRNHV